MFGVERVQVQGLWLGYEVQLHIQNSNYFLIIISYYFQINFVIFRNLDFSSIPVVNMTLKIVCKGQGGGATKFCIRSGFQSSLTTKHHTNCSPAATYYSRNPRYLKENLSRPETMNYLDQTLGTNVVLVAPLYLRTKTPFKKLKYGLYCKYCLYCSMQESNFG